MPACQHQLYWPWTPFQKKPIHGFHNKNRSHFFQESISHWIWNHRKGQMLFSLWTVQHTSSASEGTGASTTLWPDSSTSILSPWSPIVPLTFTCKVILKQWDQDSYKLPQLYGREEKRREEEKFTQIQYPTNLILQMQSWWAFICIMPAKSQLQYI